MILTGSRQTWRALIADEISFHASSPAHPRACLCGTWDGLTDHAEHVADCILDIIGMHR